ncbi:hypothetical protein E1200_12800 [Actinomadura sp. GC306]|uniref:hypothetical protein n=1 Tax=Actinomadura sp. GC306 TaxID=2530367 RepID=UPI0010468F33|nr:hypothetical protein [Actinomadura sp. GC306]TDC68085.1 hypothetical protein E1200_12800 [Actinomadura sp. GC306]
MGIDRPGGTDTRTENVEKPPAEDDPPAPPPDRPGSPGQPSRLESLRAAREAQEARRAENGAPQTAPQEAGAEQRDAHEKNPGDSSAAEPADKEQDAQAGPKTPEREPGGETDSDTDAGSGERGRETERFEFEAGQTRPDERGEQPYAAETGESAPEQGTEPRGEVRDEKAEPFHDGPADERPDAPAEPQTAEDRPMTGETKPETGEAGQPDGRGEAPPRQETGVAGPESQGDRDRPDNRETETEAPPDRNYQPLPQQDGRLPGDDENDPSGEAGSEQQPQADDEPAGHDHTPQDEPAPAEQQDRGSETAQAAEDPVHASDTPETGDAPQVRVAWLPAAEEGVTRWASPGVQFNEQMPGNQLERRDRNAEGRPGTPATTEDEPNKYRDLPDRITDGTPGRGELRDPEEDPAKRDYLEPSPDTTRRRDRVGRRFARSAPDSVDIGKKWTDDIGNFLNDQPKSPTTTSTGREVPNDPVTPHKKMTVGSGAVGVALLTILFFKGAQRARNSIEGKLKGSMGRYDDGNG